MLIRINNGDEGEGRSIRPPFKVGNPDDAPKVLLIGNKVYAKAEVSYGGSWSYIGYKLVSKNYVCRVKKLVILPETLCLNLYLDEQAKGNIHYCVVKKSDYPKTKFVVKMEVIFQGYFRKIKSMEDRGDSILLGLK